MIKRITTVCVAVAAAFVLRAEVSFLQAIGDPYQTTVVVDECYDWKVATDSGQGPLAVKSTNASAGSTGGFAMKVSGDLTLVFDLRMSCSAGNDYLRVYVDGSLKASYTPSSGTDQRWSNVAIPMSGSGDHAVVLRYVRGAGSAAGSNAAWVWNVRFGREVVVPDGTTTLTSYSGYQNLDDVYAVSIPASVETIENAFAGSDYITEIKFDTGSKLQSFKSATFQNLKRLRKVTFGSTQLTSVPDNAFKGCSSLESITLPEGITAIGDGAFDECSSLTSISFPLTLTSLGKVDLPSLATFYGACADGSYVTIGNWLVGYKSENIECPPQIPEENDLIGIAAYALQDCPWIETFAPTSTQLKGISKYAFDCCFGLIGLELPDSVEEIGTGAFRGCTLLSEVFIPGSVETIGDYAFKYCDGLEYLAIASGVQSVGKEAFYDCWMLDEVDLPATVAKVGENAFGGDSSLIRIGLPGNVQYYYGSAWTDAKLSNICSNYRHIREVTIKDCPSLNTGFFENCEELEAVRFLGNMAPTMTDSGSGLYAGTKEALVTYVPYGSTGWIKPEEKYQKASGLPQAWPVCDTKANRRSIAYWSRPTYLVTFVSNGGTLGEQVTYQTPETKFKLPPEPVQSGYTFAGWWTSPKEGWQISEDTIFLEGVYDKVYAHWVRAHQIFLDAKGGTVTGSTTLWLEQTVYGVLPAAVRTGYVFDGWTYKGETIVPEMEIDDSADQVLTAQWHANTYAVRFNANGGTGTMGAQEFVYDTVQSLNLNQFTRSGYVFVGWATNATAAVQYTDGQHVKNLTALQRATVTLYARWAKGYTVSLGANGGVNGTKSVLAAKGYDMPAIKLPVKPGSVFGGYWTSCGDSGVQYYKANGSSARNYDKTSSLQLWAKWTNKLTFGKNGGTGGDNYVTAVQGQFPHVITPPTRSGYVFDGYWTTTGAGGIEYFAADGSALCKWDKTTDLTLWAKWVAGTGYKVTFGKNGGTGGGAFVYAMKGKAMPKISPPTKSGATFAGYWTSCGDAGVQYYKPDGTSARNFDKNAAVTLYAKWTNKLTFGKNGGTGGDNYVTATQGQIPHKVTPPTRSGYVFDGYWTTTGTGGVQYFTADGMGAKAWSGSANTTLYAKWFAGTGYKVTLGLNGGTGGAYVYAVKGKAMPKITPPTRAGYTFAGYWTSTGTGGVQYYNANGTSAKNWDKSAATTLWAKWTKNSSCQQTAQSSSSAASASSVSRTATIVSAESAASVAGKVLTGIFADGTGTFSLLLDADGAAFFAAWTEDGAWQAEGEAAFVGETIVLTFEDSSVVLRVENGQAKAE